MLRSAAAVLSAACAASGSAAGSAGDPLPAGRSVVTVMGRSVVVHAPKAAARGELPLVVALHGWGSSATTGGGICDSGNISPLSESLGFVGACPDGTHTAFPGGASWNAKGCCGKAVKDGVDDVAYLRAVVAALKARARISAVYATGLSNGAMMSWRLACEAADVFDGVAPVAGGWYGSPAFRVSSSQSVPYGWHVSKFECTRDASVRVGANASGGSDVPCSSCWGKESGSCWSPDHYACSAPGPGYPVLYTHGTADTAFGGEPYELVTADFRHYAESVLGCTDLTPGAYRKGKASCSVYKSCAQKRRVAFCSVSGMGHQMPGKEEGFDHVATAVSWFRGGWPA